LKSPPPKYPRREPRRKRVRRDRFVPFVVPESLSRGLDFVTDSYLPERLEEMDVV